MSIKLLRLFFLLISNTNHFLLSNANISLNNSYVQDVSLLLFSFNTSFADNDTKNISFINKKTFSKIITKILIFGLGLSKTNTFLSAINFKKK